MPIIHTSIHPRSRDQLRSGSSAVWEGNYTIFYIMHICSMIQILLSIVGSIVAALFILRNRKDGRNRGFTERFPFYIALADGFWGVSHLIDHAILLIIQVYPSNLIVSILSKTNFFFIGYQQLMYSAVSVYTYMKVVRNGAPSLGKWDWKLHALCAGIPGIVTGIVDGFGFLGISPYFLFVETSNRNTDYVYHFIVVLITLQTICCMMVYISIKRKIRRSRYALAGNISNAYHETAQHCLTTFVLVGICLYLPTVCVIWALVVWGLLYDVHVIHPFTSTLWVLGIVMIKAGGMVNAIAYFRNDRIKKKRTGAVGRKESKGTSSGEIEISGSSGQKKTES